MKTSLITIVFLAIYVSSFCQIEDIIDTSQKNKKQYSVIPIYPDIPNEVDSKTKEINKTFPNIPKSNPSIEEQIEKANYLLLGGLGEIPEKNIQEATQIIDKILKTDFHNTKAEILKCYVFIHRQQLDSALTLMRKIVSVNPNDFYILSEFGTLLFMLRKYDEAINYYEMAEKLKPNDIRLHFHIGACFNNLNKYNDAISRFNKVLILDSLHVKAMSAMGWAYLVKSDINKAYEMLEKAYQLDSTDYSVLVNLAMCNIQKQDFKKAEKLYRKILKENPDDKEGHKGMSYVYLLRETNKDSIINKDNLLRAMVHLEILNEIYPKDKSVLLNLMLTRKKLEQIDNAILWGETAHKIYPEDLQVFYELFLLYEEKWKQMLNAIKQDVNKKIFNNENFRIYLLTSYKLMKIMPVDSKRHEMQKEVLIKDLILVENMKYSKGVVFDNELETVINDMRKELKYE